MKEAPMSDKTTNRAAHMTHCNRDEWIGACKYGEDLECPAFGRKEAETMNGPDEFNVSNEPRTVLEAIDFLRQHPPDWIVTAYEGEGGGWIIVKEPAHD